MTEDAAFRDAPTLSRLLAGAVPRSVSVSAAVVDGRDAVRVELLESVSRDGVPDVDYVDMPTFLELPIEFEDGSISVDIRAQLNGYWPEGARGFAGLAFRVQPEAATFESVYLRPTNGRRAGAPSPRDRRAIQYFAYPDWRFERLRTTYPGVYETGADIDIDQWVTLRIEVDADRLDAYVDGVLTLAVDPTLLPPRSGRIGLFVDIGTIAWFSNLQVGNAT
jgi:3-keto-disaccharide hydrolase